MSVFSRANIGSMIISNLIGLLLTVTVQPYVEDAIRTPVEEAPPSEVVSTKIPSTTINPDPDPDPDPDLDLPDPEPPDPEPREVRPQTGLEESGPGYDLYSFVDGSEATGYLEFKAFVLTQKLRWKYASSEEVEYPSSVKVDHLRSYLERHLKHRLTNATDVISVGMASCEGTRGEEESRAGKRAEMLSIWVQEARPDDDPRMFYIVNLGQYRKHVCRDDPLSENDTSQQRRIVILYVVRKDNIHTKEDLAAGILRQLRANKELLFDPADYSKEFTLSGDEGEFSSK